MVGNSGALLAFFHESTNFLKNMDRIFLLSWINFSCSFIIWVSLSLSISFMLDLHCILYCHKLSASKLCITVASFRKSFSFTFSLNKNKYVSMSFISSAIGASSLARIKLFSLASHALSPRNSLRSRNSPSIILLASLFYVSTLQSSVISSLFIIHKLCNTIHVFTISGIFPNGIFDCFIINLHLPFSIPNALSTHILVEDCIKFQFSSFSDNVVFPPLNGQYIHGLTGYATLPTSLYGWYFPSIHARPIFVT